MSSRKNPKKKSAPTNGSKPTPRPRRNSPKRNSPKSRQPRLFKDSDPKIQKLAERYHDAMVQRMEWGVLEADHRDVLFALMTKKGMRTCPVSIDGKDYVATIPLVSEKVFVRPAAEPQGDPHPDK